MQFHEHNRNGSGIYEAEVAGGAAAVYGQHQQYKQHGYEQAAATRQSPCVGPGHWQPSPPHLVPHLHHQPTPVYGQPMPTTSASTAAAYGLPMPQQVVQAAPAADQHDDTLKAVRDMPTPFQQLYSYR